MSLVGSLEDLSLGDIMQIISLSQKSGVLVLESAAGAGRIVFCGGLIQAACLKGVAGHGQDLRHLILEKSILDPAGFDALCSRAEDQNISIEEALAREVGLDAEKLEALVGDAVEAAVLEMFTWPTGDFSFDVRTESDPEDPQLILMKGINAQYIAMEGMRVKDEAARVGEKGPADDDVDPILADDVSAEAMFGVAPSEDVLEPVDLSAPDEIVEGLEPLPADDLQTRHAEGAGADEQTATNLVVDAVLEAEDPEDDDSTLKEMPPAFEQEIHHRRPLVVIDPDVDVLEWVKHSLRSEFDHVHVFQRAEQGLNRIRQYLIRGVLPVVLLSPQSEVDPLSGIHGLSDYVKRLKTQAARLPILGLVEEGLEDSAANVAPAGLGGMLTRPPSASIRKGQARADDPPAQALSAAIASFLAR